MEGPGGGVIPDPQHRAKLGIRFGAAMDMSEKTSISIVGELNEFVAALVSQGRYNSASDVVCAGLRLLEEQEAALAHLRAALVEGEQSGAPLSFDLEEFLARKRGESSIGS